jgi:hypothetical protein
LQNAIINDCNRGEVDLRFSAMVTFNEPIDQPTLEKIPRLQTPLTVLCAPKPLSDAL